jgi:uncharacterized repeat protein (TIGR01451 family)
MPTPALRQTYRHLLIAVIALAIWSSAATAVFALGTPAGTVISNTATVSGTIAGSGFTLNASASFPVAERLELVLTLQDAAPVTVAPGQTNAVATFRITNTGNGNDSYTLSATGAGISGDQFDPLVTAIYLDANGNGTFEPAADQLYTTGTGTLAADGIRTVFVLSSIPATTLANGDLGTVRLTAVSSSGTGTAGTILPGAGEGGGDAVIGSSQGSRTTAGSYVILSVNLVNLVKASVVLDPYGGSRPQPGATIRYTLTATVTGAGTANNVVVSDAVPMNTTYLPGTIRLNGAPMTDAVDADAGNFGSTAPNTVTVNLGNLTSASPAQVITFEVRIN